ncbi:MAG: hypothetical protein PHF60_01980 [Candidatus ainarchaeum sp.]|nr:hypothetical protein [Candidatus ainarchaeum sp.]
MKKLMLLLLLVPLAFATWQTVAAMAIITSAALLAGVYILGFGLGINELQILAKEELFQLIALMVMMVALWGGDGILNGISVSPEFAGESATMQDASLEILDAWTADVEATLNEMKSMDKAISVEASRGGQCSLFGMGYSVTACGGYSMLAAPLSMAGSISGFAMAEVAAMRRLVEITIDYGLSFILPLGIILRTFKMTRGAGGFLIALAVSMHIMLPAGIIFNSMLAETFLADSVASADYPSSPQGVTIMECEPLNTRGSIGDSIVTAFASLGTNIDTDSNEGKAAQAYKDMRGSIRSYLYVLLIEATIGPIIALLLMIGSLRALSVAAGTDVDVSAISRFV